jgi:GrpB-like predicted nucleotidyltransferase (UPF0157 family)
MIEIVPYKESWPNEFAIIGAFIRNALGNCAVRIDYIGSTSVSGLPSKDIIDVQVTVQSFEPFIPIQEALESIGYIFRIGTTSDHRPSDHTLAGTHSFDPDWEKRYFKSSPDHRRTNLHVRATGRANQRYALLFRDFLRRHPESAAFYAEIKRSLVKYHADDTVAYVTIKDPVCDLIMSAAEKWASATNWQPGSTDA